MTIPTHTPAKNIFSLPTHALKNAIEKEWESGKKYSPENMPLTAIAYTAIDKISDNKPAMVEVLMVYVDSDTLTYLASGSDELKKTQEEKWGAVLKWLGNRFDVSWKTTSGVMPEEQSPLLHKAIERYLNSLNEWQLAAFAVLSSCLSSIALAIAICEKHLSAADAFKLSRLEEEYQAEKWGRDEEAEKRAKRIKEEIISAEKFLRLQVAQ